jgi:hypothetical protein
MANRARPGRQRKERKESMAKANRKAGLDIVVKVTDAEDNLRGRFLISANSLYYFRKTGREPVKRYTWRQLIEMIEGQIAAKAQKKAAKKATPTARSTSGKKG